MGTQSGYTALVKVKMWARGNLQPQPDETWSMTIDTYRMKGVDKRSLTFIFEAEKRMASLTIWESGESELQWVNFEIQSANDGRRSQVLNSLTMMIHEVAILARWAAKTEADDL